MKGPDLRRSFVVLVCAAAQLGAQERKGGVLMWVEKQGKSIISIVERPLHPVLGSVAPGGGIGSGLGFETPATRPWRVSLEGLYTTRRFWGTEALLNYSRGRVSATAFGRLREMPKLDYFGPGPDSDENDRTNFSLREGLMGVVGALRLTPWLTLGARVEQLWPEVRAGRSSDIASIETRFGDAEAPGLAQQPRVGRYEGSIGIIAPAAPGVGLQQGGNYRLTYGVYNDQELQRFSFRRFEAEGQHRFAPFGNLQRLTLHGWLSTTDTRAGQDVPFFLQRTLGGTGDLRSVSEALIGSDGTQATLRGFTHYRYRDRHLLLLQAEYRIPLWGPIEGTLFTEAGKVASSRSDLDLQDLKRSYGGSFSIMRGPTTAARLDIGFGGEGTRVFVTIGRDFKP